MTQKEYEKKIKWILESNLHKDLKKLRIQMLREEYYKNAKNAK